MKTNKYLFLMLLIALCSMNVTAQQRNILQVPDVTTQIGNAQLPVSIENTDEIVGVQFDLTLPKGVTAEQVGIIANRGDGHSVTVSQLSSGAYRVMLHSPQNRPLRGQSGVVMYLPITIPASFEGGSEHPFAISNAVLGKATGENVLTEAIAGSIRISKLPDLTVKNITCDEQMLSPGDHFVCSWQVENIGEIATGGGWSEQVSLISEDGKLSKLVATIHCDDIIDASGIVSRQAEITLPTLLGIDGQARLQVRIVPDSNTGESTSAQGNNTLKGTSLLHINKILTLEMSPNRVDENSGRRIALRVNRSGQWTIDETFKLSATGDCRLSVPSSITIPAGQSGTVVYLTVTDNDVVDDTSDVTMSVEGNDYPAAMAHLTIDDNELPDLQVTASKSVVNEGETFQLTITASRVVTTSIEVTLTSENDKRFTYPRKVTIPAGQNSVTVNVMVKDDDIPSEALSVAFTASTPRYNQGETIVLLEDDDMPVLQLTLTPNKIVEGAGPVSVTGTLRRTGVTTNKITVRLSDDSNGALYFGTRELVLNKGVEEVNFNFGPIDNTVVDGDRILSVTAAVWLSSCSCSAAGESAGSVSAQLQVFDDDGPALTLSSTVSTIKEGGKTTLTISRNTLSSLDQLLTVHLSSDYDENLSYAHTVTIPAGQQTAQVEITSTKNDVSNDSHTVVFTVQADGFASGTCWLMVTDQTLPDAMITDFTISSSEVEAGGTATINVTVTNGGSAVLPKQTQIDFFISGSSMSIGTLHTITDVAPGGSITMTKILWLPTVTGSSSLYCVVNNNREVDELLYSNNASNYLNIQLLSPYRATVACDKEVYLPGEIITLTGKVEGNASANSEVEIYLINDGSRQTLSAVTDSEGKFSLSYRPYEKQMGHFVIGACYPGEKTNTEQATFDYIGIRRSSQNYITCEVLVGTLYEGTIEVENPTALSQHNIRAEVVSIPDNCNINFSPVSEISAGGKYSLNYTIEGTAAFEGTEWKNIIIRIVSDEGASTEFAMYCYCRLQEAQLTLDIAKINTSVTKGIPRDYPISITNNGAGETGRILLSMPSNIQTVTSQDIASVKPGETATILLRFTTTDDMPLNVPFTGQIGINCENGNGLALPFTILPVAETEGTLIVDVCDEYTYYTEEAPHVKGAKVTVKYPYSDEVIATGTTDDNGLFEVELSEGYYALTVTADKHESYQNNLLIDPGKENRKVVNLSYEGITVNWNVEDTEVEDEYEITTTVTYETNVPVPIVITELPDYIPVDSMAPGESRLFYATLTNKGLIAAEGVQLIFPETEYLTFEPLIEFPFKLLPQQAIVVPFKVTLDENVPLINGSNEVSNSRKVPVPIDMGTIYGGKYKIVCEIVPKTLWFWICGSDHQKKMNRTPVRTAFIENCHLKMIEGENDDSEEGGIPDGRGGFLWFGGDGGSKGTAVANDKECMTCWEVLRDKAVDELIDMIPIYGCMINAGRCSQDEVDKIAGGQLPDMDTFSCMADATECVITEKELMEACAAAGGFGAAVCTVGKVLKNLHDILKDLSKCMGFEWRADSRRKVTGDAQLSFAQAMDEKNAIIVGQIDALFGFYKEIFGDEAWLEVSYYDLWSLLRVMTSHRNAINENELADYRPENISEEQFNLFVNRVNNSFFSDNKDTGGQIDFSKIKLYIDSIVETETSINQQGYLSTVDMWLHEYNKYRNILMEGSNSVCASVSFEIKQIMTLTRPAYRGTLVVFNGHEDTSMTDVKLNLMVKDEYGNIVTAREFQINAESIEGFGGEVSLEDGWTLDAQQTGKATVLFIPTKYAAPTEPKKYSFGGMLNYIDPFTGLEKSMNLTPVQLTVNPLPDLELTYLMQRDVYGDDPLTEDVVEPVEPAEFALIIDNKGYGEAKNVRMLTEQPRIVENEKGLLIDFQLVKSQVNGEPATLSFGQSIANNFGTIPAHSQAYAQWWLESSLLGHFTSYEVAARHVTSYGNADLSLVDTVTIHEMIHGFTLNTMHPTLNIPLRGYLVNDIADAGDLPDAVYFTDALQQDLYIAQNGKIDRLSENEFLLNVMPSQAGWNYGSVTDPTHGRQKLTKIVRKSDGVEIPVDNIWQTDRTLRDGINWLYENRLHFVGNIPADGETFVLTFEPKPELELAVESYNGVPKDGTVLKEQLTTVTVKFNKPIKAETFTIEDITLYCQGIAQDASQIVIEKQNEQEYKLILNDASLSDGYYVLTVQTAGIEDNEGFNGSTSKQTSWIQYVDGKVALIVNVSPAEGGTVTPESGRFIYDSDVILKATPAEGYSFSKWMIDNETVSTDAEFTYHLYRNTELTALFKESVFTGLQPLEGDALHVTITPLPLRDNMFVSGNFKEIQHVSIYDMRGIKCLGLNNIQSGQGIYVSNLKTGIYYVQIVTDRGIYRTKVIKR